MANKDKLNRTEYGALEDLVRGVLKNNPMTLTKLVACLASEPYNVDLVKNLKVLILVLEDLNECLELKVKFLAAQNELTIVSVFSVR